MLLLGREISVLTAQFESSDSGTLPVRPTRELPLDKVCVDRLAFWTEEVIATAIKTIKAIEATMEKMTKVLITHIHTYVLYSSSKLPAVGRNLKISQPFLDLFHSKYSI